MAESYQYLQGKEQDAKQHPNNFTITYDTFDGTEDYSKYTARREVPYSTSQVLKDGSKGPMNINPKPIKGE